MNRIFSIVTAVFVLFLWVSSAVVSDEIDTERTAGEIFAEHLAPDQSMFEKYPELTKAYEDRNQRLAAAMETQVKRLEILLDREKRRADLNALTLAEKIVETVKTRHANPCLINERFPPPYASILKDLNQEKSRSNKRFLAVVDREIAKTLRNDGTDAAKKIERFLLSSFIPKRLDWTIGNAARLDNKIFLKVDMRKDWQDAQDWCRELNGNLASVTNKDEQAFLFKNIVKEQVASTWIGGFRVDGKWYWVDGNPFLYMSWMPGEPSGANQTRLAFAHGDFGGWDDDDDQPFPFIIQWTLY